VAEEKLAQYGCNTVETRPERVETMSALTPTKRTL